MTVEDVEAYAAGVRAELADLSADESAELLEDLEDHLREVAAEDVGTLRERLGTPAQYARELRESAGLPPRGTAAAPAAGAAPRKTFAELVTDAGQRVRATGFGGEALAFLPTLRPAWWVLRAWVVVRLAEVLTSRGSNSRWLSVIPSVYDNAALGLVLLGAAIIGSVGLARRGTLRGWLRGGLVVGQALLIAFAVLTVTKGEDEGLAGDQASPVAYTPQSGLSENGHPLTNLYVYDRSGKLISDVFVYDQDGNPVEADYHGSQPLQVSLPAWSTPSGDEVRNVYPRNLSIGVLGSDGAWHAVPMPAPATHAVLKDLVRAQDHGTVPANPQDALTSPAPSGATPAPSASTPATPPSTPAATTASP